MQKNNRREKLERALLAIAALVTATALWVSLQQAARPFPPGPQASATRCK
jgi:hypothetical protein